MGANLSTPPKAAVTRHAVYIASPCGSRSRATHWRSLRASGIAMSSTWIDEGAQSLPAADYWARAQHEIAGAIGVILCVEEAEIYRKEPLIEAALALGMGKPVAVLVYSRYGVDLEQVLGSWVHHRMVTIHSEFHEALQALQNWHVAAIGSKPLTRVSGETLF